MAAKVDLVFKPICLRFSQHQGSVVYHVAAESYAQLDGMERLMGIDTQAQPIFDMNLGFLPVAHTVLIRDSKCILVDPNNYHISGYGMLGRRLKELGADLNDIDVVVNTHCHHDHSAGNRLTRDKVLVVGEGELDEAETIYGSELVHAYFTGIMREVRTIGSDEGLVPLDEGVHVVRTPGHSSGSVCVLVEAQDGRWAIMGDTVMFREEYTERAWGHWYTAEQKEALNAAVDLVAGWGPTIVVPGHDQAFSTGTARFGHKAG
jgi:glyoxylase-like metal-dependent hydrolase (beta-lactamase superfamily II)